RI
ncbi:HAMP domain protein, partial [Vibrio parahaemolyticus AQ3810]